MEIGDCIKVRICNDFSNTLLYAKGCDKIEKKEVRIKYGIFSDMPSNSQTTNNRLEYEFFNNSASEVDVIITNFNENTIYTELKLMYNNMEFIEKENNEDGLIAIKSLIYLGKKLGLHVFMLKGKLVFLNERIGKLMEVALETDIIAKGIKLRFDNSCIENLEKIRGKAPIYGISLQKAIEKIRLSKGGNNKIQKAHFYCEKHNELEDYPIADMFVKLETNKENNLVIEAWQAFGYSPEAHYIHGIMSSDDNYFTHLDGAIIYFEDFEVLKLIFLEGRKQWGYKTKYFRIDTPIPLEMGFELAKAFLPMDYLLEEYLGKEYYKIEYF
jgi:hypothetical protein